ncbi:hypothetical protein CC80DRAFT_77427 [Byssothecium circinans]|uniref:Secreted protein n=1 Tax=Byssothecium circinans TaxID=147558 RepID=A0A6A5TUJ8_9PLEO|nr:hypothetical protein CC80DRAFT_77427 [Byssothecium circinans]
MRPRSSHFKTPPIFTTMLLLLLHTHLPDTKYQFSKIPTLDSTYSQKNYYQPHLPLTVIPEIAPCSSRVYLRRTNGRNKQDHATC